MYQEGQRVVVREEGGIENVGIVEEVLVDNGGQKLKVKDPTTGQSRVVNPMEQSIVEQLED